MESKKGRGKVAVVPANETPEAAFKRLGEARLGKVLRGIHGIGNLSGSAYKYTPEQVSTIEAALDASVKRAVSRLRKERSTDSHKITL